MQLDETTTDLIRQALIITLKIAAPILGAGIVFGLLISLAQSVTSIQDQTLATVPKIVIMVVVALLLLPWVIQRLIEFSALMFGFAGM